MRIVIAGGTGFLGRPLAEEYATEGHDVRVLTRALPDGASRQDAGTGITRVGWKPDGGRGPWAAAIAGAHAVVNLAGESLAGGRWTPQRKTALRDSRIIPARSLAAAIRSAAAPPAVFVSNSGVGYYGPSGDEPKTEADPPGTDFIARLCEDWEAAARQAEGAATRVVVLRAGVVLHASGGALARMIPPFKLFAGGPMGSGRQYMPWIHRTDWIAMVRWAIARADVSGAVNSVAPQAVTNREFARALGRALHRPAIMPIPALAMKLLYGEMAESLLLSGPRVVPARATALGFRYEYPDLSGALSAT